MSNKRQAICIFAIVLFGCAVMAVVDGIVQPPYAVKSAVKVVLFLALPMLYSAFDKRLSVKGLFRFHRKGLKLALGLGISLYILILGAYLLLKDVFDFSAVTTALTGNIGVNRENFIFVALYISFINSLLEEFFFRGFAFLTLKKAVSAKFAAVFSAAMFALYHIAMMTGWFSVWLYLITVIGLFAGGLIFNYLNDRYETIYTSWFVHMSANFAINTIGFMLFGIL